jgi:hypothetical protein
VVAGHFGHFLIVDILSGDYEIDEEDLAASNRLLARRPNGVLYGLRIGYPAAYRLGGYRLARSGMSKGATNVVLEKTPARQESVFNTNYHRC